MVKFDWYSKVVAIENHIRDFGAADSADLLLQALLNMQAEQSCTDDNFQETDECRIMKALIKAIQATLNE